MSTVKQLKTFIVDAFTDIPFRGNPAGVCLVKSPLTRERMLQIAQELNLSETAFLSDTAAKGVFSIRYFSPKMGIPLCGHATLASAKIASMHSGLTEVHFETGHGVRLTTRLSPRGIEMEFPVYATEPAEAPKQLLAALGVQSVRNTAYNSEANILLLEIASTVDLAALDPDFAALKRSHHLINGVLVTAPCSTGGYDYHCRYFWPWSGSDEDRVTGGTQTFLARYWSTRLGKTRMRSFQSSRRTGSMEVELDGEKVLIRGQAVVVLEGHMMLDGPIGDGEIDDRQPPA